MVYYLNSKGEQLELASLQDVYAHFGASNNAGMQLKINRAVDQTSQRHFRGVYISTDSTWTPSVPKPFEGGVSASLDLDGALATHAAVKRMFFDESTDQRTRNTIMDRYQHVVGPAVEDIRAQYEAADEGGKTVLSDRYSHVVDFNA